MTSLINNISIFFKTDLLTYCLSSIWIISFSLIICYFFNKKIKDTLVLSYIISFILLFFGGLINNIKLFSILGWVLIIVFYLLIIFKKKINKLLKEIDLETVIIYLCFSLIIYIYYQEVGFRFTDEYMHWGPMVKEMFRTNQFYCSKESLLLVHKDYPPFFSLIELLFCYFGNSFVEKYLYIGLVSFVLSIIVCISFNNKNRLLSLVGLLLIGFIFQYIPSIQDNTSIYNSIYIDYPLSLLFVYIIDYLTKVEILDNYDYKVLALCFTALVLSKQIGIIFFVLSILYLLFIKRKNNKIVICILMPLIFFTIWKTMIISNGINGQFSFSNISIRPEVFSIFKTYINAFVNRPLFIKPFSINSLLSFVVVLIVLLLVDKSTNKRIFVVYSIGLTLYIVSIGLLYMFVFSIEEALILSSFERYIISYVYIGIALIVTCICNLDRAAYYIMIYICILSMCDFSNSNINKVLDKKNILVINQQGADVDFRFNQTTGSIYTFEFCDYLYENDKNKFNDIASKYDYVYVYLYDDYFYRIWCDITNDKSLENDSLFYIKEKNPLKFENSNFNMIYYVIKYCINENNE